MSYGMMGYMIDTDFLASLWHCDDPQRLEQVYQATKGNLRRYESELELRSGAMYMALRSIINGNIPAKHYTEHRVTYACVIEAICGAFGVRLDVSVLARRIPAISRPLQLSIRHEGASVSYTFRR